MRTPWQRKTVTFPGIEPFPALVDPFQDNYGKHLVVTEKHGPKMLMKAHSSQLSAPMAKDYDEFTRIEDLYVDQLSRAEMKVELERLIAKTRKDNPGVAAILLTLSACVDLGTELKMAAHVRPFNEKNIVAMAAMRAAEN